MTFKQRASDIIAHGALTNSKRPSCFVEGVYPTHVVRGQGCFLWDDRGKRFIDFAGALGTNLLGYAKREITQAVRLRIDQGSLFSLSSTAEVEFGELVANYLPFVERIKVLKSGSEGCSAAVRIARAFTGRDLILSSGYHGWHDEFTSLTPPANGVPRVQNIGMPTIAEISTPDTTDLYSAAAVIIEPVDLDYSPERVQWLKDLRDKCTKVGALLIFDETITGLRFPGLSVAKWSGVYPDLIVMGKALGNGLPISIVGGKADVMNCDYFVSSTFAGDLLPMAAATAVLPLATERIDMMWTIADKFKTTFNEICTGLVWLEGYPTRSVLRAKDDLTKALFMQETCKAGLLFGSSFFWCEPHAQEIHFVQDIVTKVIAKIKNGECRLEGEMPRKPFAQVQRDAAQGISQS